MISKFQLFSLQQLAQEQHSGAACGSFDIAQPKSLEAAILLTFKVTLGKSFPDKQWVMLRDKPIRQDFVQQQIGCLLVGRGFGRCACGETKVPHMTGNDGVRVHGQLAIDIVNVHSGDVGRLQVLQEPLPVLAHCGFQVLLWPTELFHHSLPDACDHVFVVLCRDFYAGLLLHIQTHHLAVEEAILHAPDFLFWVLRLC